MQRRQQLLRRADRPVPEVVQQPSAALRTPVGVLGVLVFGRGLPPPIVALRRGDIIVAKPEKDPKAFKWKRFATGFHNACGIHIVKPITSMMGESSVSPFRASLRRYHARIRRRIPAAAAKWCPS